MSLTIPSLPYAYNALEPYIDEETMRIHHDKHHQAYFDKFQAALADHNDLKSKSAEELLADLTSVPEDIKTAIQNNGGGHANHSLFWKILKKDVKPSGEVKTAIEEQWGSLDKFQEEFTQAALTQFGSGWAWLVVDQNKKLAITKTANQNSPLSTGQTPILNLDVWEHAYYLKYQNRRAEYIENFFQIINWEEVNNNYLSAKK
ncbi:MAG: superoxide dismutase [Patescibacteria group bacterium]|jgi:Fe-Mn family superoxide dismutase|nr:superoxide dismutase [Patescibacteria group bacterium]